MKVLEYGKENREIFVMFQCAVEPGWAFEASALKMADSHHVYLFVADGHDEAGTDFVSVEKYAHDAAEYLRRRGVERVDCMYGISMGGSAVIRFLAAEGIPVEAAVIDAGITPYPYPSPVSRLISLWDWMTVMLAIRNMSVMKMAAPPDRWTPEGEDPDEHYRRIFEFEKGLSSKTIYNVFWSANNYAIPDPVRKTDTKIEYWYGEEEKKARKADLAYVKKMYPQTKEKEFPQFAHAELVLMFPDRFAEEIRAFLKRTESK